MRPRARNSMGHIEYSSHFGSDAFPLEHLQNIPRKSFEDNVKSYFGEYLFSISRYEYELHFNSDTSGISHIVDPHDGKAMTVKAQRAIKKREDMWKNTSREVAEYQGLISLEEQLCTAPENSTIIWTSPPGAPEDGYGDYGFFFVGTVNASKNNDDVKKIIMTAFRINNQTVEQCSRAISQLTCDTVYFQNAEECIAHPTIVSQEKSYRIPSVLQEVFHFTCDIESEQLFEKTMKILHPTIQSFIDLIQSGASKEMIQRGFYAIENYAIGLRRIIKKQSLDTERTSSRIDIFQAIVPFHTLVHHFGSQPPPAISGSCGSTSVKSGNIFNNSLSSIISLLHSEQSEDFICPNPQCKEKSTPPVGDSCPKCGITKNEAKKKGFTTC